MLSPDDTEKLRKIKTIRATNNDHWMELLAIALEADPERTKQVLSAIRSNDEAISMITRALADDHPKAKDQSDPATVYYR